MKTKAALKATDEHLSKAATLFGCDKIWLSYVLPHEKWTSKVARH